MKPLPAQSLPPALDAAVQRLKLAAREAAKLSIESLGLAAMSAAQAQQREQLLAAQYQLQRRPLAFSLAFNDALDERLIQELGRRLGAWSQLRDQGASTRPSAWDDGSDGRPASTHWDSLSLVDDEEVEAQIAADRFALEAASGCEWQLRELDAYLLSILPERDPAMSSDQPSPANPLRPAVLGHALIKAINAISERSELRKLMQQELGRSFGGSLADTYASIVTEWRASGLQPASLSLRQRQPGPRKDHEARVEGNTQPRSDARDRPLADEPGYPAALRAVPGRGPHAQVPVHAPSGRHSGGAPNTGAASAEARWHQARYPQGTSAFEEQLSAGPPPDAAAHGSAQDADNGSHGQRQPRPGQPGNLGVIDPGLMSLIRQLAQRAAPAPWPAGAAPVFGAGTRTQADAGAGLPFGPGLDDALPTNLIHAHREELRQAAPGRLDHLVIDVVGFLFDQILSDPKVPPQVARELARLQLPVLRAALGDSAFFSARKHPVRRLVNRIAALGSAFEDFNSPEAQAYVAQVQARVHDIVEGDFEQIALYQRQLQLLEQFASEQAKLALRGQGLAAAELVAQKEDELRLHQLYAQRLHGDLASVAAPAFVLEFLSQVWSQVLLRAQSLDRQQPNQNDTHAAQARSAQAGSERTQRLRQVARDLVHSVQPKSTPAQRQELLAGLPVMMRSLTEGMNMVAWPAEQRQHFFGQLMPAHAQALKSTLSRQIDINMTLRQVEGAWAKPPPTLDELQRRGPLPVLDDVLVPLQFSDEEAQRIGLVQEASDSAHGDLDIDLDALAAAPAPVSGRAEPGHSPSLPQPSGLRSPVRGAAPLGPGLLAEAAGSPQLSDKDAASAAAANVANVANVGNAANSADAADQRGLTDAIELPGMPNLLTEQPPQTPQELAERVQLGCAYEMRIEGAWHRVQLSHLAGARSFYIFTRGNRHTKTVSMTHRMLLRLCEGGRFRAIETSSLIERATQRARRQLAALAASPNR